MYMSITAYDKYMYMYSSCAYYSGKLCTVAVQTTLLLYTISTVATCTCIQITLLRTCTCIYCSYMYMYTDNTITVPLAAL